ncbi:hypothetical protein OOZ51_15720 [Arthrobacter sp. MI7-26]|uniref:hypothetical protein n=1 Tax=Arthrobacter sp. MI7-26 TaxID=2993653 RepID=UPI0022497D87|nr:hypothetical protein [Arthrobacter sp. MI7-26]MCX2749251.1 hypothetical protein [Arthrobacter sp. MI7-26]
MTPLNYTVIDAPDSSLNKTSVLVTGESEALLVDAGSPAQTATASSPRYSTPEGPFRLS